MPRNGKLAKKGGRGEPPERKAHGMGLSVGRMTAQSLKDSPIWIPPQPDADLRLRKAA